MNHRHLTPQEIELLVDGEEGSGMSSLAAHLEECVTCRTSYEDQQQLVTTLEQMTHFTPSPLFAYRVMRKVEVFEPWHVAATSTIQRFLPKSRTARVLAAGVAAVVATSLTAATVWLAGRLDTVAFLGALGVERVRNMAAQSVTGFVGSTLGQPNALFTGDSGIVLAAAGFLAVVAVSAFGLRAIAAASRRRRM